MREAETSSANRHQGRNSDGKSQLESLNVAAAERRSLTIENLRGLSCRCDLQAAEIHELRHVRLVLDRVQQMTNKPLIRSSEILFRRLRETKGNLGQQRTRTDCQVRKWESRTCGMRGGREHRIDATGLQQARSQLTCLRVTRGQGAEGDRGQDGERTILSVDSQGLLPSDPESETRTHRKRTEAASRPVETSVTSRRK